MYKSLPTKPCKLEVESPREATTITTADFVERVLNQREQECPSRRKESAELILAVCCGSIGLPLSRNQTLSKRVCRPCGPKILNTAELYNFIEKAARDLNREAGCGRSNQTSASYNCHAGTKPPKNTAQRH